jgi:large subunit ribosomal protein L32
MAHPKSRVSAQRKRKRRTHYKIGVPQLAVCKTTGEPHLMHRAYSHEGALFYKGQMVVAAKETAAEESED